MHSFLTLLAIFFASGLASELQGDVVKDPYNLCSSPLEELKSLDLIELRQYATFGEGVRLPYIFPRHLFPPQIWTDTALYLQPERQQHVGTGHS